MDCSQSLRWSSSHSRHHIHKAQGRQRQHPPYFLHPPCIRADCAPAAPPFPAQLNEPCGGTSMCGKDGTCSSCCVEGAYCQRQSAASWTCQSLAKIKGGFL